jgi:hypothetical protein
MTTSISFDIARLEKAVQDTRKDALSIDFARLIGTHFAKMAENFSRMEGRPIQGHNNKTLFLEAIDIWCRSMLCKPPQAVPGALSTENPKDVVRAVMRPWYEALEMDDPSRYRMGRRGPIPVYVGRHEDATAYMLGVASCLEIGPVAFRFGKTGDAYEHIWGRIHADNKVYDSDLSNPTFKLGDHYEFEGYEEVEVPL